MTGKVSYLFAVLCVVKSVELVEGQIHVYRCLICLKWALGIVDVY